MGYWANVAQRALKRAAESVGLATAERIIIALVVQGLIALLLWLALGQLAPGMAWTRILTTAVPFILLPVLFLFRLLVTPPELDRALKAEIASLRERLKSDLELTVDDRHVIYVLADGAPLKCIMARVENTGVSAVERCTLKIGTANPLNVSLYDRSWLHDASAEFSLRPREIKNLPVLFWDHGDRDAYAIPETYRDGGSCVTEGKGGYVILPGDAEHRLDLEVFSANAVPVGLSFIAKRDGSGEWTLIPR